MQMDESSMPVEGERRVAIRRLNNERRFGERRAAERASAGRRVDFVPDRRTIERRSLSPELAV
jgi:hypothetical protein